MYLDGGMEAARALIHRVLLDKEQEEAVEERRRDYKTELQELVQRRSNQTLHYEMIGATGPDHAKLFTCAVLLNGQMAGTGTGKSSLLPSGPARAAARKRPSRPPPGRRCRPCNKAKRKPRSLPVPAGCGAVSLEGGLSFLRPGQPEAEENAAHTAHNVGQMGHVVRSGKAVGDFAA